jgi:hypothetical protein
MYIFQVRGMTFIPDNAKPDIDRESDAKTYSTVELSKRMFWNGGYVDLLHSFVNDSYA